MASRDPDWRAGLANLALVIGSAGSIVTLLLSLQFFGVERGQHVRPMGWVMFVLLIAAGTFLIGLPSGIAGCYSSRRRFAVIGICLSLAPYPVAMATLHLASSVRGFLISP